MNRIIKRILISALFVWVMLGITGLRDEYAQSPQGGYTSPAQGGGGISGFPATVTGGVSGGIPYFSSATQLAASALLTSNVLVKGGGAGVAPSNSSIIDNGTTVSTAEPI